MRTITESKLTGNSALFRKLHKINVCNLTGKCTRCPWHRVENASRTAHRSWKNRRKSKFKI